MPTISVIIDNGLFNSACLFQDLKTELSKLEQDHSKWKKKSQQIAMSIDDSTITQKEENKHFKDVANNRKEQTKLLSDALVYRMECNFEIFCRFRKCRRMAVADPVFSKRGRGKTA